MWWGKGSEDGYVLTHLGAQRKWKVIHLTAYPSYFQLVGGQSGKELPAFASISYCLVCCVGLYVLFNPPKIIQNDESNHKVTQKKMVECFKMWEGSILR